MSDKLKAIAFAVLTVIAAYFLATVFGAIGRDPLFFLPLDILVYLAIGFFSARALGNWRGAFVVVLIAALVDAALAVGSLILPGAPRLGPPQIIKAETIDVGFNALIGLVGAVVSARIGARRLPPIGAFALFALMATASAGATPAISIVPSGSAATLPLAGRMLVFMQPVADPKSAGRSAG